MENARVQISNVSGLIKICIFFWLSTTLFFIFGLKWKRVHYYRGHYYPTVPAADDDDECGAVGGTSGSGNRNTRKKTFLGAAMSTTNPI
jgi:hypothetical protein